jgi:hypothetical protein
LEAYITTISKQWQWDFIARFGSRQLGKTETVVKLTSKEMPVERVNSKKRVAEDEGEEAEEGEKVIYVRLSGRKPYSGAAAPGAILSTRNFF